MMHSTTPGLDPVPQSRAAATQKPAAGIAQRKKRMRRTEGEDAKSHRTTEAAHGRRGREEPARASSRRARRRRKRQPTRGSQRRLTGTCRARSVPDIA
eukprot:2041366-Rhodomonas_salina.3